MIEVKGDLWSYVPASVRLITTNGTVKGWSGRAVMGRGCALEALNMTPGVDKLLGDYLTKYGNRPFYLTADIGTFPVKHEWYEKADLDLIRDSAYKIVEMADGFGWQNVVLPRPGCGNGKLQWSEVRATIGSILDERFKVITW